MKDKLSIDTRVQALNLDPQAHSQKLYPLDLLIEVSIDAALSPLHQSRQMLLDFGRVDQVVRNVGRVEGQAVYIYFIDAHTEQGRGCDQLELYCCCA